MKFSEEQKAVVEDDSKFLSVNAYAGSGKTHTMIGYAQARANKRKLYICFNKTAQTEAQERFVRAKVPNIVVQTAHSLAYSHFGRKVKLFNQNPKTSDIIQSMSMKVDKKTYPVYRHGYTLFLKYLQSADRGPVEKFDMESQLLGNIQVDSDTLSYFYQNESEIRNFAKKIWNEMQQGNIPLVHDFYLKWFQLYKPKLGFELILFDEAQDANPAMLDLFFNQPSNKVMIGDEHQAIYGWRGAVNALSEDSLKKNGFNRLYLSNCYRFGEEIASLGSKLLNVKRAFNPLFKIPPLVGLGKNKEEPKSVVVIGRSNGSLLELALENVSKTDMIPFHVEGGVKNFSFFSEGVSLYDIYSLFSGKKSNIRSPFIAGFKDLQEFKGWAINTGDHEFIHLIKVIERYKGSIFFLMKKLQSAEVEKDQAKLIFTTCHKAKGLEYDKVQVMDDFLSVPRLISYRATMNRLEDAFGKVDKTDVRRKLKLRWQNVLESVYQEINLLYVAVTRSKHGLSYSDELNNLIELPQRLDEIRDTPYENLSEQNQEIKTMLLKQEQEVDLL